MKSLIHKYHLKFGLLLAAVLPALFSFQEPFSEKTVIKYIAVFIYILNLWAVNFVLVDFKKSSFLAKRPAWYLKIISAFIITSTVYILIGFFIDYTGTMVSQVRGENLYSFRAWAYLILRLFLLNMLILVIKYLFDVYEQKQQVEIENHQLRNENLNARHEVLKRQLKPHFLFNSLNTLKSLVRRDQGLAEEFINELALIYRYMLSHQNKKTVTLNEEVTFLRSYVNLLKIRFGEAISTEINVPNEIMGNTIPPNTLQLLIENAVKHNVFTQKKALHITLFQQGPYLVVQNNIQNKEVGSGSSGLGLTNINARYRLLFNKDIVIRKNEKYFQVFLPLS